LQVPKTETRGLHVKPNPPLERGAWLRRQILQRENLFVKNDDGIGLVGQVSVVGQVTATDVEVLQSLRSIQTSCGCNHTRTTGFGGSRRSSANPRPCLGSVQVDAGRVPKDESK